MSGGWKTDAMARTLKSAGDRIAARDSILRAAHDVFAADGYRSASLDAIAQRAGVTRGALLYHFRSKEALLRAILDVRDDELGIPSLRITPESEPSSPQKLLGNMGGAIERVLNERGLVALAHSLTAEAADPSHPAHDWLVSRSRRIRDAIEANYRDAFAKGELEAHVDAKLLAALSLAAVEGLEAQWLADPDGVDVVESLAAFEKITLLALRPNVL